MPLSCLLWWENDDVATGKSPSLLQRTWPLIETMLCTGGFHVTLATKIRRCVAELGLGSMFPFVSNCFIWFVHICILHIFRFFDPMARPNCRQAAPKWVPRPAPAPEKVPEPVPEEEPEQLEEHEETETNDEAQGLEQGHEQGILCKDSNCCTTKITMDHYGRIL